MLYSSPTSSGNGLHAQLLHHRGGTQLKYGCMAAQLAIHVWNTHTPVQGDARRPTGEVTRATGTYTPLEMGILQLHTCLVSPSRKDKAWGCQHASPGQGVPKALVQQLDRARVQMVCTRRGHCHSTALGSSISSLASGHV